MAATPRQDGRPGVKCIGTRWLPPLVKMAARESTHGDKMAAALSQDGCQVVVWSTHWGKMADALSRDGRQGVNPVSDLMFAALSQDGRQRVGVNTLGQYGGHP